MNLSTDNNWFLLINDTLYLGTIYSSDNTTTITLEKFSNHNNDDPYNSYLIKRKTLRNYSLLLYNTKNINSQLQAPMSYSIP
ncbi:hypothetical protein RIR_jg34063.t1 [Rhizophagus irregularis DAOM 181602=DAOM 197198]|uniref:Uncharacterized protein n=1 Tax=Rhizophagus irregularis (strain DAOM 181602 / DAOM 197198 / MUCL 43194) TaxID=747089 RepID=U9UNL4_RHIID|nr:hypothetical protein RIR_jg34063.t1 [Rhizophagus irregularis DAOM 181602=DAOM 197198]